MVTVVKNTIDEWITTGIDAKHGVPWTLEARRVDDDIVVALDYGGEKVGGKASTKYIEHELGCGQKRAMDQVLAAAMARKNNPISDMQWWYGSPWHQAEIWGPKDTFDYGAIGNPRYGLGAGTNAYTDAFDECGGDY